MEVFLIKANGDSQAEYTFGETVDEGLEYTACTCDNTLNRTAYSQKVQLLFELKKHIF